MSKAAIMTVYRTCYGCILRGKPCERRDAIAKVIKGLNIQSLKFKCGDRKSLFAIGAPVWVETVYDMNGEGGENGVPLDSFPGHIIEDLGTRALVYIKPGSLGRDEPDEDLGFVGRSNGFCKVVLTRISAREGDVEALCKECSLPASMGHLPNYACDPAFKASLGLSNAEMKSPPVDWDF